MKQKPLLDLYADYVLASCGATTATGLSHLWEGEVSPDQVPRPWSGKKQTAAALWLTVKPVVRQGQAEDGVWSIDDASEEKPYPDEHDLGCWQYDHSKAALVTGSNCLTALSASQEVRWPVGCQLRAKTETYLDHKT
jgi:hypothetical protein